jgi:hypothetical protein
LRGRRPEADISFFSRLLFAAYFLEAGLVLVVAPWSRFWDRNIFLASVPLLEGLVSNLFLRGAVSGVGIITAFAGLAELAGAVGSRRRDETAEQHR